ncbi:translation initiation factor IF-3 [Maricaulis virginensis]|jgi:translation initiation factor IF-3|uniref:Translation initiation factor IF-3 n=1 Tax=Maricaulis virginensis TaxID=144022 RepID=A0A9W6IPY1_9PROT|nr:translation initiation factor IF-3 [Maricaulis virginensis]GLK53180.1 translation initiation factor IF-3 [Maricaulis virginensis]|tara:strand:+ start:145 stop:765 length:621 start_codon:yes stop_codon:yes gene_type:complete
MPTLGLIRSCRREITKFQYVGHKGEEAIARRPHAAQPPKKEGPRTNRDIRVPRVLLIDEHGEKQGIMPVEAALEAAEEAGLDLVEVSPNADPPVCKIVDYGKLKYQEQKKKAEAKKKQKIVEIKEIKMRPNIDVHDYQVKTKAMHRFFEAGDKVKVTLRFRGREMAHQDRGMDIMNRVKQDFAEVAKVEFEPKLEGRLMVMVMAPR